MSFKMVTGISKGEMPWASCMGLSSQQVEHNLGLAAENHGAHFNVPLHKCWRCSDSFSTSPTGGEHNFLKRVLVWIFLRWLLILGDPSSRSSWPRPYSAVEPEKGLHLRGCVQVYKTTSTDSIHLSQQRAHRPASQMGWWRILLFKTCHPATGLSF